jgi:hypothetical protein
MAMSGVDGKSFTIDNTHNLSGPPLGAFMKTNKWLPPVLVVSAITIAAFLLIKKLRRD